MANIFETEMHKSFRSLGWYSIKVPVATKQGISFLHNAPFDFIAVNWATPFAFEAKMCKYNDTSFPLSRLEVHQIENLLAFAAVGGKAYITITFRKPKLTAFVISIEDWRDISKELHQIHHRKSVPRSWFTSDKRFIPLPRIKFAKATHGWDFNVLKPKSVDIAHVGGAQLIIPA